MKILQLTPGYTPVVGGVERHVQALSERLAARGHEVVVGTMQPRGQHLADAMHAGVVIRRFSAVGIGEAYRVPPKLLGFLQDTRNYWDVVHVHNYHAALIPLVAVGGVRPFVVTTHLNDMPHSTTARLLHVPYSAVGRWAVQQAQAVICVTEAERERVRERLGIELRRSIVIPNGVSEAVVAAGQGAVVHDPYLLLSVGRLQPYKRVEDAIRILAELKAPYHLVIVGDGPHRTYLEQLAEALDVRKQVNFAGKARDEALVEWYRRAGVVLSLSEAEAFGMTVLEGVAAGCQVVCSDIPAFRDLADYFGDRVTVVPRGDPGAGAAAVRAAQRGIAAAPPDVSAFTWNAVTERVLDVYRRVTGVQETTDPEHMLDAHGEHLLAEG
ncbi:MAG: glycosyltransferase family 4 protein [Nitrososphaerales archaeon]